MERKVYQALASAVSARINCTQRGNVEWFEKHSDAIESLCANYLPSGSGFDAGTKIDLDASNGEKLIFATSYHHMDENGMYCGWSEHTVTVTASLCFGFHVELESDYSSVDRSYTDEETGETLQETDFSSESNYIAEHFEDCLTQTAAIS